MNMKQVGCLLIALLSFGLVTVNVRATVVSTAYGISRQANVNTSGQNIPDDAANEPSICIDPIHPEHIAIGWRQFDTTNSNFRQSGVAFTTNGGLKWTFPGNLEPGVFRSDPVLATDANGTFYYLGISNSVTFSCDLLRSANGGATWQQLGFALGGDKEWMTIDTTSGPGRGNIYEIWSPYFNYTNNVNKMFTRSTDGGQTWLDPIAVPQLPYWGTLDVGPGGELYCVGTDGANFWVNRSTNAPNRSVTPSFDLTVKVELGGPMLISIPGINPDGLLGQAWLAADRSSGPTRLPDLKLGFPAPLRLSPPRERFNSAAQAREHVLRLASSAGRIVNMPPQITHSLTLPARPFLPYVGRLESTRRFGRGLQ